MHCALRAAIAAPSLKIGFAKLEAHMLRHPSSLSCMLGYHTRCERNATRPGAETLGAAGSTRGRLCKQNSASCCRPEVNQALESIRRREGIRCNSAA